MIYFWFLLYMFCFVVLLMLTWRIDRFSTCELYVQKPKSICKSECQANASENADRDCQFIYKSECQANTSEKASLYTSLYVWAKVSVRMLSQKSMWISVEYQFEWYVSQSVSWICEFLKKIFKKENSSLLSCRSFVVSSKVSEELRDQWLDSIKSIKLRSHD